MLHISLLNNMQILLDSNSFREITQWIFTSTFFLPCQILCKQSHYFYIGLSCSSLIVPLASKSGGQWRHTPYRPLFLVNSECQPVECRMFSFPLLRVQQRLSVEWWPAKWQVYRLNAAVSHVFKWLLSLLGCEIYNML